MMNDPVSWLSKKQSAVALPTAEAECISLSSAAQEAMWFRKLLGQLSAVTEYHYGSESCATRHNKAH